MGLFNLKQFREHIFHWGKIIIIKKNPTSEQLRCAQTCGNGAQVQGERAKTGAGGDEPGQLQQWFGAETIP